MPPIVKSHLFDLPAFGETDESRCLVADGAPIRSRQLDPNVPPHDVISRYFGALANAPSLGQAANLVALEFVGHGACGAGAQLQLRGADGKLTALTGTDADLLLPFLVLVTNAPVPAGAELTLDYGDDYFPTISKISDIAHGVKREEEQERCRSAAAGSSGAGPSTGVQVAGAEQAAGAGQAAGVGQEKRVRIMKKWIKPVDHPRAPRVPETLTQTTCALTRPPWRT